MEENLDKLFDYRPLIPGSGRFASIVGIGGGAGRVVDQMRKCCLPDVQLYAFGMNRKEMDELSLCGKYLIGQEGLGSGKDRFLAEYECSKSFPAIERCIKGQTCGDVCGMPWWRNRRGVYQVFPAEGQRGGKQGNHSGGNDSPFVGGSGKAEECFRFAEGVGTDGRRSLYGGL